MNVNSFATDAREVALEAAEEIFLVLLERCRVWVPTRSLLLRVTDLVHLCEELNDNTRHVGRVTAVTAVVAASCTSARGTSGWRSFTGVCLFSSKSSWESIERS